MLQANSLTTRATAINYTDTPSTNELLLRINVNRSDYWQLDKTNAHGTFRQGRLGIYWHFVWLENLWQRITSWLHLSRSV